MTTGVLMILNYFVVILPRLLSEAQGSTLQANPLKIANFGSVGAYWGQFRPMWAYGGLLRPFLCTKPCTTWYLACRGISRELTPVQFL